MSLFDPVKLHSANKIIQNNNVAVVEKVVVEKRSSVAPINLIISLFHLFTVV